MMTQLATAGEGGEEDDSDEDDRELMPGEEVEEDEAEEESESDGDGEMIVLDPDHVRKIWQNYLLLVLNQITSLSNMAEYIT